MTKAQRISEPEPEATVEPASEPEVEDEPADERETFRRPRSHEDADKLAAGLGLDWPDGVGSLDEKIAYLSESADLA